MRPCERWKSTSARDVDAPEAVAVGDDEGVGVDVALHSAQAPARGGLQSGLGERDLPVLLAVGVELGRPGVAEAHGEVGDLLAVAEEVLLDLPALEAEAEDEALRAVVAEQLHDVPQDRALADADERLGDALGLLAHAGAEAAGEDHHRHPLERRVAAAHARTRRRSSASTSPASTSSSRRPMRWKRGERNCSSVSCLAVYARRISLDALLHAPPRGEEPLRLGEAHAVGALVGAGARRQRDLGAGRVPDHAREVADLVVVLVAADVERLVVDGVSWRLERGDERARRCPRRGRAGATACRRTASAPRRSRRRRRRGC